MENNKISENKFSTYYDLEVENIILDINKNNYKEILMQFPDGLKYYSKEIIDELKENTKANYFIYFGSCFGACDVPLHLREMNFDLLITFGHSKFIKDEDMW